MRRSDREITDKQDILDVLNRCDTVRIGISGQEYPYVVPLSFGWEEADGAVMIYLHGAKEGLKHDLLALNPRVCVEADICHGFVKTGHSLTCAYESVIGFGTAVAVTGEEAAHALAMVQAHCGFAQEPVEREMLPRMTLYKIVLKSLTGKRREVKD